MRVYLVINFAALALIGGYITFTHFGLQAMPLNERLAYDAMVKQIGKSLHTEKSRLQLAPVTMLSRPDEIVFMGEGTLDNLRRAPSALPFVEKLTFKYIMIINRQCTKMDDGCYQANELSVSAENSAIPMI